MSERNKVVLVDEYDNAIKIVDKMYAHEHALLHRAFSVMLYRHNHTTNILELLLQQRAEGKYHCPGLWTNTCCSHPQLDETLANSGLLRLKEELADIETDKIELKTLGSFIYEAKFDNGLTEYEFDHVLLGRYDATPNYLNQSEVQRVKWLSFTEIESLYQQNCQQFTPWFYQVFTIVKQFLEQ